ncbi:unnamed protein product [Lactuca virosa]|uniref:Uncharacterized protein n=1 Tax=Lactuca virosa TaxID=75947 RepID=A0AAU9MBR1_9ASTR|nr:unnamed protein product [Lactuca virosa]
MLKMKTKMLEMLKKLDQLCIESHRLTFIHVANLDEIQYRVEKLADTRGFDCKVDATADRLAIKINSAVETT